MEITLRLVPPTMAGDMVVPQQQRGAHLALVARPIVNPRDAALVAALMVQNLLDDVRHDAEIGHARGDGST